MSIPLCNYPHRQTTLRPLALKGRQPADHVAGAVGHTLDQAVPMNKQN